MGNFINKITEMKIAATIAFAATASAVGLQDAYYEPENGWDEAVDFFEEGTIENFGNSLFNMMNTASGAQDASQTKMTDAMAALMTEYNGSVDDHAAAISSMETFYTNNGITDEDWDLE